MSDNYHILKNRYGKMVYIGEQNNQGHLCIKAQHIDLKYLKKYNYDIFVEFIYISCLEALKISKKYDKHTFSAHMDLERASMKNISIKLFRKMNKKLSEKLVDVLDKFYIYGNGLFLKTVVAICKSQLDPVTKKKILLVNREEIKKNPSNYLSSSSAFS